MKKAAKAASATSGDSRATESLESRAGIFLDKQKLISALGEIGALDNLADLKAGVEALKYSLGPEPRIPDPDVEVAELRRDIFLSEIDQILDARTLERARYYVRRLDRGIRTARTAAVNDINLSRWKEYDQIITDSLWLFPKRDTSGEHLAWYWGNFIPQIPRQVILRYTKRGDWVLDPFVGSGTTLIECRRLGRNGLGLELSREVAEKAAEMVARERNKHSTAADLLIADARTANLSSILAARGLKQVQLLIAHPPYHDILKFSEEPGDLSNAQTTGEYLQMFGEVVDNVAPFLEGGRYFALVIGDKYTKGEWQPLGFYCMQEVMKRGFRLKGVVVKNFEETRAKREQKQLWRYRALAGGFYVFKHEYIMIFKKAQR